MTSYFTNLYYHLKTSFMKMPAIDSLLTLSYDLFREQPTTYK